MYHGNGVRNVQYTKYILQILELEYLQNKMFNKGNAKGGVSPRLNILPLTLTFDLENQ